MKELEGSCTLFRAGYCVLWYGNLSFSSAATAAATATTPGEQAFIAFDDPPDVQVYLEPWGLDEWARIALQQALAPYVLPG